MKNLIVWVIIMIAAFVLWNNATKYSGRNAKEWFAMADYWENETIVARNEKQELQSNYDELVECVEYNASVKLSGLDVYYECI